jgi:hypothetical protein
VKLHPVSAALSGIVAKVRREIRDAYALSQHGLGRRRAVAGAGPTMSWTREEVSEEDRS